MLSSGIIDLAIGIIFVFGVVAALSSVVTELIARILGLRGAYLLLGLRELLDSNDQVINLGKTAETDYASLRTLINDAQPPPPGDAPTRRPAAAGPAAPGPAAADSAAAGGKKAEPESATGALLGSPILRNQGMPGQITSRSLRLDAAGNGKKKPAAPDDAGNGENKPAPLPTSTLEKGARKDTRRQCRSLPSYISARSFAEAVIDMLVPDNAGQTTMNTIQYSIGQLPDSMSTLRTSLEALAADAAGDMTRFRTSVENWYDDHMARVSGWYKRHVTVITLVVGAVLVLLLNLNAITIGRALYSDSAIRSAVSSVAAKGTSCPAPSASASASPSGIQVQLNCLGNLETQLTAAAQAGLPLGWGTVTACAGPDAHCNLLEQRGIISPHGNPVWAIILVLLGFLITIAAVAPGAQFWFGLLVKLGGLRATGPPPSSSTS
jgi:hypothetical protein